jgi:MFS family permease
MAAVLGQSFTTTAVQFLGARIAIGFFSVFINVGSIALLLELAHRRQRAVVGALYSTFFFVGSITAAWTSFGSLDLHGSWPWRLPVLTHLVFITTQITVLSFTPESPRWLISKGRMSEAAKTLAKYHAHADGNDELISLELSEIHTSLAVQRAHGVSWRAVFATAGNRKRFIICVFLGVATQSAGNGIISYYFAPVLSTVGISNPAQQQLINGGLQIYNWLLSIAGAIVTDKAGRRKLLLISSSTMLLFMVLIIACSAFYANTKSSPSAISVIVFHFLFLGGYVVGFTPIPNLYIAEIWSTELRAKGTSIFFLSQTLSTCFNQYVNPIGLEKLQWRYYFVFLGVLAGVVIFIFLYIPETKGRSLEEVGNMFDIESQAVTLVPQLIQSQSITAPRPPARERVDIIT